MNLLTNPVFLRMAVVFAAAAAAFILALLIIRALRRRLVESPVPPVRTEAGSFSVAAYSAVIQKLKEKEDELERLRRQATDRAAATENISAAVISNLASGVVLFNASGLVQHANRAAREILGYASVSGLASRDLFRGAAAIPPPTPVRTGGARVSAEQPFAPASLADAVQLSLRHGLTFRRIEVDYTTPAGDARVLGVTISPVLGASGEKLGAACLISDLTEIAALGRQMRLRENLAALGEMAAGIAHEFKNALTTISGYSQMLASESDPAVVRTFAARIDLETAALSRIVTDFLNFARPRELCEDEVDLRALLARVAAAHHVELSMDAARLPSSIPGDPTALEQAFANLFRNSVQAAGGRPVRVEINVQTSAEDVTITYRDDAGGIPPDLLPKIFIPFFTTKPNGTGLGLALVHRIVTQHGGAISVANQGSGAAFTLSLPLRKTARKAAEAR